MSQSTAQPQAVFLYLLWCVLREGVHRVPADLCVYEDKSPDSGENVRHAGLQLHPTQRIHAQVEKVQVGDVGNNGANLVMMKKQIKEKPQKERLKILQCCTLDVNSSQFIYWLQVLKFFQKFWLVWTEQIDPPQTNQVGIEVIKHRQHLFFL